MLYSVDDLKKDIRIVLDQNTTSGQLFGTDDIDTLSLEEIIGSKLEDAARVVEKEAPVYLLDGGEPFAQSISWDSRPGYGSGRTQLPDDFLRLVSFQMSDWERPVSEPISDLDPRYALQRSRYPGIRGNPQKPVVAIVMQPVGQVLEFYSCTGGPDVYVKRARYIPIPKIDANKQLDICEKLHSSFIYYAASLVALSTQQGELSSGLLNTCKELMK